jgi:hypothetical protein
MMWLNLKIPGGHRSSWMKQILLFSVILCLLVAFNPSRADDLTDPGSPDWGHPWDDPAGANDDPSDPPEEDDALLLQFGFHPGIIILLQPAEQKEDFEAGRSSGPAEKKNRGHLFILIK